MDNQLRSIVMKREDFYKLNIGTNYYISKSGKVVSICGSVPIFRATVVDKAGYLRVGLSFVRNGKHIQRSFHIHSLVMETFVGKRPEGMVIDHVNCDKTDNRLENLRYVTAEENLSKAHKGVKPKMKMQSFCVLNDKKYVFPSVNQMCVFLKLTRSQYTRIIAGSKNVCGYKIESFEEKDRKIYLKLFEKNYVCSTTNPDECKGVERKQTTLQMAGYAKA